MGRFLSADPVTAYATPGQNFNRYWYANNNPFTFKDTFGRKPCDSGDCPTQDEEEQIVKDHISDGTPGQQPDSFGDALRQNIKNDISEMVNKAQETVRQCAAAAASCTATEIVGEDAVDAYANVNIEAAKKGVERGAELYGTIGARLFIGRAIALKNVYDVGSIAVCTVQACASED